MQRPPKLSYYYLCGLSGFVTPSDTSGLMSLLWLLFILLLGPLCAKCCASSHPFTHIRWPCQCTHMIQCTHAIQFTRIWYTHMIWCTGIIWCTHMVHCITNIKLDPFGSIPSSTSVSWELVSSMVSGEHACSTEGDCFASNRYRIK